MPDRAMRCRGSTRGRSGRWGSNPRHLAWEGESFTRNHAPLRCWWQRWWQLTLVFGPVNVNGPARFALAGATAVRSALTCARSPLSAGRTSDAASWGSTCRDFRAAVWQRVRCDRSRSTTVWAHIFRVGSDGEVEQHERQFLRELGMDKIAIAQIVTQTKDGGRLTRAEVITIANGFILRKNPQCRKKPLTPSCKALFATARNFDSGGK